MKILILYIFLGGLLFSCTRTNKAPDNKKQSFQSLKYLALGDSYTIGESVEGKDRFPSLLANDLHKLGYEVVDPRLIAKTGWTTDELALAIQNEQVNEKFDLVTLLIGVNNQYRGRSVEEFRLQYRDLLSTALDYAQNDPNKVIVLSIPDWGVSPFAEGKDREKIAAEIDLFNQVKKEETLKRKVEFVDITGITRSALNNPAYFAEDGLHFSGEMHQLWVDELIKQCYTR